MMYAIVEIAGQQFKVVEGKNIFVHRLDIENEKEIEFDQVLLIEDEGKVIIGEPTIKDAVVEGKILEHVRGDKVIVFKKKRKKGYRIKNGHRQNFTQVQIVSIREKAVKKVARKEEATASASVEKTVSASEVSSTQKKPAAKKATPAKATEKAVTAKKTTTKKATAEKKPTAKKPAKGKE
jgi:large subunit ribosomal protein L21